MPTTFRVPKRRRLQGAAPMARREAAMSGRRTFRKLARPQEERSDGTERARRTLTLETGTPDRRYSTMR
jgi:hypothetical protein